MIKLPRQQGEEAIYHSHFHKTTCFYHCSATFPAREIWGVSSESQMYNTVVTGQETKYISFDFKGTKYGRRPGCLLSADIGSRDAEVLALMDKCIAASAKPRKIIWKKWGCGKEGLVFLYKGFTSIPILYI